MHLEKARERLTNNQGQQIRLNSEADGYSPDDREWKNTAFRWLSGSMRPDSSLFIFQGFAMNQTQKSNIAFIQASWHPDIVEQSYLGFEFGLANGASVIGYSAKDQIDRYHVPGSLEIPLQAQLLANTGQYSIIVAAGLIVDGGIYRHDFVAKTVLDGMMQVQLAAEIPILSLVLTPHQFQETEDHIAFFSQHFYKKGTEAAQACIETLLNLQDIRAEFS